MNSKILLPALLLFSISKFALSQTTHTQQKPMTAQQRYDQLHPKKNQRAFWLDVNLEMGIPMNEYAATTDALPCGLNMSFFYQPVEKIPIMIGGDLGYMNAGSISRDKTLTADITVGNTVIDQLYIPLNIAINSNILNGHVILRGMAPTNYFKPFVEGVFGFQDFWTATTITDNSDEHYLSSESDNTITSKTQLAYTGLSYGGGGGFLVQLSDNFFINAKVDYLLGSKLKYYDKEQTKYWDVSISDPVQQSSNNNYSGYDSEVAVSAVPHESTTDMLLANLGIVFKF